MGASLRAALCVSAGLLYSSLACASAREMPALPQVAPDATPRQLEKSVEADIEASMPTVSYSVSSPHFPELVYEASVDGQKRGERHDLEVLLRELESMHGQKVVCRAADGRAFGDCVFPVEPEISK